MAHGRLRGVRPGSGKKYQTTLLWLSHRGRRYGGANRFSEFRHGQDGLACTCWREKRAAGEGSRPSKPLTGPAPPRRSVCAPEGSPFLLYAGSLPSSTVTKAVL